MPVAWRHLSPYHLGLLDKGGVVSDQGKERLERALIRLSRAGRKPAGRGRQRIEPRAAPAAAKPAPEPESAGPALPEELLELVDRLDSIADRLADLEPGRPLPATRAIFSEWVRLRKQEEIPFADFLTLRRAGRI